MLTMNKYKFSVVIVVGIVILSISGFYAVTKAEIGAITACIQKNGLVHFIGTGFKRSDCKKNEQLVTWNTQGATGPQGPVGPMGSQGPIGLQGEPGLAGSQGETGAVGSQGQIGPQGIPGISSLNLILVDAVGTTVGLVMDTPSLGLPNPDARVTVYDINNLLFLTYNLYSGAPILDNRISQLAFTGPNCTGQTYAEKGDFYAISRGGNGKLYRSNKLVGILQNISFPSHMEMDGLCRNIVVKPPYITRVDEFILQYTYVGPLNIELR